MIRNCQLPLRCSYLRRRKTERTGHMFGHPARILVNNGLLAVISVVAMREACFAQSKRENKGRKHDGGRLVDEERVKGVRQIDQCAVLRKARSSSWKTDVVNRHVSPDRTGPQKCQHPC